EIAGRPYRHAIVSKLLIASDHVGGAPVVRRQRDGAPSGVPDVSKLEGVDVFRFQVRVADPDVERVVVAGERIQPPGPWAVDTTAVARPQNIRLVQVDGQKSAREEAEIAVIVGFVRVL